MKYIYAILIIILAILILNVAMYFGGVTVKNLLIGDAVILSSGLFLTAMILIFND